MKENFKILSLLLPLTILFSCSSIPRTMGPYIEVEVKNKTQITQSQQQNKVQVQQSQTQPQTKTQLPQTQTQAQQTQQQTQTYIQPQQQRNYEVREDVLRVVYASDAPRLKTYNIIIGSFSVKENALNFATSYKPIVVVNEKGMYRVIIASFDSYEAAKEELEKSVKYKFSDAWILAQKK